VFVKSLPYTDPIEYVRLFMHEPWCIFLDSADHHTPVETTNRYSYLGFWPFEYVSFKDQAIVSSDNKVLSEDEPFRYLQRLFAPYKLDNIAELPPFQGGLMGFLSYDLCYQTEPTLPSPSSTLRYPYYCLGFYDSIMAFDHHDKKAYFLATGIPNQSDAKRKLHAQQKWRQFSARIKHRKQSKQAQDKAPPRCALSANFSQSAYCAAVNTVKQAIKDGELFEANISQCFSGTLGDDYDLCSLYQNLRASNPAPFSAYFKTDEVALLSSSPERFIRADGAQVQTRPIKGTVKRSAIPGVDQTLKQQLVASAKDRAENIMIVDLMRNDLSKVCTPHSVQVTKLCGVETFPSVHHLVSVVEGTLAPEYDVFDLLRATFPGGSITGAPKIAAMQYISAIEPIPRGPYCGSMIALGFNGYFDSSILIRTLCVNGQALSLHCGGAVVLDSDPLAEYHETLTKAGALYAVVTGEAL